jgi:hypothetical protein
MPMQLDPSIILNSDHDRIVLGQRELDQRKREGDARIAVDQQEAELRRQEILARREEIIQRALERNQPKPYDPVSAGHEYDLRVKQAAGVAALLEQATDDDTYEQAKQGIAQIIGPDYVQHLPPTFDPAVNARLVSQGKALVATAQTAAGKTREIRVPQADGSERIMIVSDEPGQEWTGAPKTAVSKTANLGSFEDYVTRTYGDNPTSAQILKARKEYNQSDDKATGFAASDVTKLTPQGLDIAALNYRKTGVMPPLGMGDKGNRQAIINRAATLTPDDMARIEAGGLDLAANRANYGADSGSLKKLQAQRDAITAFENTAQKNIDIFLETAGKVVDTGSPMANSIARVISGKMLGSPDQVKYDAARQVALSEIARIVQNPNLTGQLSDSARQEIEVFNPSNATLAQSVAVMRLLKRDMANRKQSLDDALKDVRGRIGGGSKKTEESDTPRVPGLSYQDYQKSRGKK